MKASELLERANNFVIDCNKQKGFGLTTEATSKALVIIKQLQTELAKQPNLEDRIKELEEALERDSRLADAAILSTPSGDQRNFLTEININRLAVLAKGDTNE